MFFSTPETVKNESSSELLTLSDHKLQSIRSVLNSLEHNVLINAVLLGVIGLYSFARAGFLKLP